MSKLPNKYGYQPRDKWEADDLDAEADYWRNHQDDERKPGCPLAFVGLVLVAAGLLWGTGAALAQVHDVMPVLQLDTVYLPQVTVQP